MTSIALCPNCGGQKTVSKPTYISGDVNTWVGDTSLYPCPTCDGRGWIRVDSVAQEDFVAIKSVALSSMETSEALMDECTKRADRIRELETECNTLNKAHEHRETSILKESDKLATKNILLGDMLLQNESEIERLRMKIFDIEGREDLVTTELERRAEVAEKQRDNIAWRYAMMEKCCNQEKELLEIIDDLTTKNQLIECQNNCISEKLRNVPNHATWHSQAEVDSMRRMFDRRCEELASANMSDRKLLGDILHIVNPLIKSGAYAKPAAESRLLSIRMHGLCQTVVQFRRKHNIVG